MCVFKVRTETKSYSEIMQNITNATKQLKTPTWHWRRPYTLSDNIYLWLTYRIVAQMSSKLVKIIYMWKVSEPRGYGVATVRKWARRNLTYMYAQIVWRRICVLQFRTGTKSYSEIMQNMKNATKQSRTPAWLRGRYPKTGTGYRPYLWLTNI